MRGQDRPEKYRNPRTRERHGTVALAIVLVVLIAIGAALIIASSCAPEGKQGPARQDSTQMQQPSAGNAQSTEAARKGAKSSDSNSTGGQKPDQGQPLKGFTICIDAGHGNKVSTKPSPNNPDADKSKSINTQPLGTTGRKSGYEYAVNLKVAKYLQADLEQKGASVVMVRTTNNVVMSPKERAEVANEANADMFIRLHCDSAGSKVRGFYTLIPANTGYQSKGKLYKTSQSMGKRMHRQIVSELGQPDRGTTVRSDQGGFNWCKVPCVLFEMGNMDNARDDALLATKSYQKKLAQAIANAAADYLV